MARAAAGKVDWIAVTILGKELNLDSADMGIDIDRGLP